VSIILRKLLLLIILLFYVTNDLLASQHSFLKLNNSPISIEASSLEIIHNEKRVIMDGKVRVINEDISLTTDYMELFYNLAEISNDIEIVRIYCDGNVLIEFDDQLITSQIAEYDLNSNSLLLKKEVLISKNEGNNIKAEEVIVDLNTMRITMKSDERVRAFITPNN
jgi:lipopolysaccharide export system protein LptA